MKKRILFVDDEPNVLDGIRRLLKSRFKPDEWELGFCGSGAEALSLIEKNPFDVVVSDMRMPGMNGVELLTKVMHKYPQTVRFILSGYSDRELIIKSIGSTHQYMSKPCDAELLVNTINRAFAIREVLQKDNLKKLVAYIKVLPALPDLYLKVVSELKSPDVSAQKVGEIITKDVAMSVKVLQLVNSAFFGLRRRVESPAQAVTLLGLDVVKSLVLMLKIFSDAGTDQASGLSIERLSQHSLRVGQYSQAITRKVNLDKKTADDAFMAGLFHDLGKLVLIANLPEQYGKILHMVHDGKINQLDSEMEVFGATHSEVGAYLLGLWGFPDPMIEAALYHHYPAKSHLECFSSLTAVHVGNVIANEMDPPEGWNIPLIDREYLDRLKLTERIDEWRQLCKAISAQGEDNAGKDTVR